MARIRVTSGKGGVSSSGGLNVGSSASGLKKAVRVRKVASGSAKGTVSVKEGGADGARETQATVVGKQPVTGTVSADRGPKRTADAALPQGMTRTSGAPLKTLNAKKPVGWR